MLARRGTLLALSLLLATPGVAWAEETNTPADPSWPSRIYSIAATGDGALWAIASGANEGSEKRGLWKLDPYMQSGKPFADRVAERVRLVAAEGDRVWYLGDGAIATFATNTSDGHLRIPLSMEPSSSWLMEALPGDRVAVVVVGAASRRFSRVVFASTESILGLWRADGATAMVARSDDAGGLWISFDFGWRRIGYARLSVDGACTAWLPAGKNLPGCRDMGRAPGQMKGMVGIGSVYGQLFAANRSRVFGIGDDGQVTTRLPRHEDDDGFQNIAFASWRDYLITVSTRCDEDRLNVTRTSSDGQWQYFDKLRHECVDWNEAGRQIAGHNGRFWVVEPGGALLQYVPENALPWERILRDIKVTSHEGAALTRERARWDREHAVERWTGRICLFVGLAATAAALWESFRRARRWGEPWAAGVRIVGTGLVVALPVFAATAAAAEATGGGGLGALAYFVGLIGAVVTPVPAGLATLGFAAWIRKSEDAALGTYASMLAAGLGIGLAFGWTYIARAYIATGSDEVYWFGIVNSVLVAALANLGFVLGGGRPKDA